MATTLKQKRNFILKTLLPYKEDRSKCAVSKITGNCLYLTEDGKKCAVGVHLKKGKWQYDKNGYYSLINKFGKKIFKKNALKHEFQDKVWNLMQQYHDSLAKGYAPLWYTHPNACLKNIEESLGIKLPELYI